MCRLRSIRAISRTRHADTRCTSGSTESHHHARAYLRTRQRVSADAIAGVFTAASQLCEVGRCLPVDLCRLKRLGQKLLERGPDPQGEWREAEIRAAFLHIAFRAALLPRDVTSVPVDKIIQFRLDHETALRAFYDHLAALETDLRRIARIESPEAVQVHLNRLYRTETKPRLHELQQRLRMRRIDSVLGTLQFKLDPAAASGTVVGAATMEPLQRPGTIL